MMALGKGYPCGLFQRLWRGRCELRGSLCVDRKKGTYRS